MVPLFQQQLAHVLRTIAHVPDDRTGGLGWVRRSAAFDEDHHLFMFG